MNRKRVAILISGRGSNMAALIADSKKTDAPYLISLVVSNRMGAAGLAIAAEAGIATQVIDHERFDSRAAFDAELDTVLTAANIDIICLAGFMRILSDEFVRRWSGKILNIHPSLLPAFKGLHTHQRAIDAGVRFSGLTVHFVEPELDDGPIILQRIVPVDDQDTAESLAARILKEEHSAYPEALRLVATDRTHIAGKRVIVSP